MARKRHLSRIAVMQVLFERERHPQSDQLASLQSNGQELGNLDEDFACTLLAGIIKKEKQINKAIEEQAPDWSLDRMDPIARCVLQVATWELLFGNDAPVAVIINEAIDIAKEYGTDESGKFVNGVLNAIAHRKD